MLDRKPKLIVECGAGTGELTRQLSSLIDEVGFKLVVISDKPVEGLDPRIEWRTGLSYKALPEFESKSIDLCIIDTDHNYWTLVQELIAVFDKITEGGLIAMHDVETFYHDTGMAMAYSNGEPYPKEEIEKTAVSGGLGDALISFLSVRGFDYKLMAFTTASHGAAVLERRTTRGFTIMVPGVKPPYGEAFNNEVEQKELQNA